MGESSPHSDEALRFLGKYALIEKLGEGHLGPVFRGIDQDLGKPVVVRILSEDITWDPEIERLFFQAWETVSGLEHANIASIFDTGKTEKSLYIVMESLGRGNLHALLKKKPAMSAEAKLSIMVQVAEGLSHAHKKTILHGDLKPGKIHVMPNGSVKIRDFALAQILTKHLPRRTTHSGVPIYLSPEQIQNKDTDERSEIFSLGTIFYELLTYLHPFHDPNYSEALDKVLHDNTIPTFEQFPDVPPGFWPILKTCLAPDPEDRYQSMDKLLAACKDLRKSLSEDTQLMLAELYASQNALKKAAAQPNASESTLALLQDIQNLSQGDKKPDCVSLDKLMEALIEQYPIIQAAADIPDTANPLPDNADVKNELAEQIKLTEETPESEDPLEEGNCLKTDPPHIEDLVAELQDPPTALSVKSDEDMVSAAAPKEEVDVQPGPIGLNRDVVAYILNFLSKLTSRYRTIPGLSFRSASILIVILAATATGFIFWGTEVPARIGNAWGLIQPKSMENEGTAASRGRSGQVEERIVIGNFEEIQDSSSKTDLLNDASDATSMQNSVQKAGLSSATPGRTQASIKDKKGIEQERAARMRKEDEWNGKLTELFSSGNYNDAGKALNLWLKENPGSIRAKEFDSKLEEIQRGLSIYASAMSQNRYKEALNALQIAEAINPTDPGFAALRQQIETRQASARAVLTVRRLGEEAELFLDDRPIGSKGEIINESIPIGNHIVSIKREGSMIASRKQEHVEGKEVTLIYDLAKPALRPMVEADQELLARRKIMEKVHRFDLDHKHGLFRRSCRGVLSVDYYNFEYKPFSGQHEFRIPFKLLRVSKIDGRSIEFSFNSDNKHFQNFEFPDNDSMDRFIRMWRDLKAIQLQTFLTQANQP